MFDGLKSMMKQKDFILLLVIFFVGLGMFNGVTTWIEVIVRSRGFSSAQAGILGGLMLLGGIIGAVAIPMVSDKLRLRKPFIIMALAGLVPGTYALEQWDTWAGAVAQTSQVISTDGTLVLRTPEGLTSDVAWKVRKSG